MSLYCKGYYDHVCNNHLNLRNKKLSPNEVQEILYCPTHQNKLPLAIQIRTADLTDSGIRQEDLPEVVIGLFGKPIWFKFNSETEELSKKMIIFVLTGLKFSVG